MITELNGKRAELIENEFPKFESFWSKHLQPLKADQSWRNDTIEYLEYIGMANFAVLKSINFINRNRISIDAGDPDQRFKAIYYHFGLIGDTIEDLARNILISQNQLKIKKLDIAKQSEKELISAFKKWIPKKYKSNYKDLINKGKSIVYFPSPQTKFISLISPKKIRSEYYNLIESLKKYRNFYTHNLGVDIIKLNDKLYVIKREHVNDARSWSKLRAMIYESTEKFINTVVQIRSDQEQH